MDIIDKKQLYESIMTSVAKEVKKALNEDRSKLYDKISDAAEEISNSLRIGIPVDDDEIIILKDLLRNGSSEELSIFLSKLASGLEVSGYVNVIRC